MAEEENATSGKAGADEEHDCDSCPGCCGEEEEEEKK